MQTSGLVMDDIDQIGYAFHPHAIGYEKYSNFWLCETAESLIIVNSLLRVSFSVTSRGRQAKNRKLKIPIPACSLFFRTRQPVSSHHAFYLCRPCSKACAFAWANSGD